MKIYVPSASGGAEEKGKTGWNSVYQQNGKKLVWEKTSVDPNYFLV